MTSTPVSGRPARAFDRTCQLDARGDLELAEDVAQVRLDCLEAEEQLDGDLGVCPAIDYERGNLALAFRQRVDAGAFGAARARAPVHGTPELAQLALGGVAQARRAAPVERRRRALQLGYGLLAIARKCEGLTRERARERLLDHRSRPRGAVSRHERSLGSRTVLPGGKRDVRRGAVRPRAGQRQP